MGDEGASSPTARPNRWREYAEQIAALPPGDAEREEWEQSRLGDGPGARALASVALLDEAPARLAWRWEASREPDGQIRWHGASCEQDGQAILWHALRFGVAAPNTEAEAASKVRAAALNCAHQALTKELSDDARDLAAAVGHLEAVMDRLSRREVPPSLVDGFPTAPEANVILRKGARPRSIAPPTLGEVIGLLDQLAPLSRRAAEVAEAHPHQETSGPPNQGPAGRNYLLEVFDFLERAGIEQPQRLILESAKDWRVPPVDEAFIRNYSGAAQALAEAKQRPLHEWPSHEKRAEYLRHLDEQARKADEKFKALWRRWRAATPRRRGLRTD